MEKFEVVLRQGACRVQVYFEDLTQAKDFAEQAFDGMREYDQPCGVTFQTVEVRSGSKSR